ncbi:hypothetical protein GOP47_0022134 [Adiantum capillus-veneris]|uniref:Pentatricopeptide repeat-containing protein n=1 Tax=Adiantum capillus-veneris TaxID=13818 RepID=A0A9D4U960_ADICA|nr:hypothetical protein GOP47_0022134 [Adiantum capillus-veneris]
MRRWSWKAQSFHFRRWLYSEIRPNESTQKLRTSAATSMSKRKTRDRLLCTAVVSHDVEGTSVTSENMEEIDFKSFFPAAIGNNGGGGASHGSDFSAGADDSLVEAQSKLICTILDDGVCDCDMRHRLGPFVKILSPALVARVLNRVASVETAQSFFKWVAQQEGYKHDGFVYNALMLKLGQAKNFTAIEELVDKMQAEDCAALTSSTFSIIIKSYGKARLLEHCWRTLAKAELLGVKVDARMYTTLLWVLFNAGKVLKANQLVHRMEDSKVEFDLHTYFTIIQGLCKNKMLADAQKLFDRMMSSGCLPNAHVYNAIILGFCESGDPRKALSYYEMMQKQGCEPDTYTYNTIIQSYCHLQMSSEAEGLVSHMQKAGCEPNHVSYNILLQHYSQTGNAKDAENLFMRMQAGGLVDGVSYKLYCSLLRRLGNIEKLVSLAENVYSRYGNTDLEVCNAILQYYCEKSDVVEAAKYLNEAFVRLSAPNESSYALMMSAYCKVGDVYAASSLLSTMVERGCTAMTVHYDLVIVGLCEQSRGCEALQLFKEMNVKGVESSSSACERLLTVLSDAGVVDEVVCLCNHIAQKKHHVTGLPLVSFMKCMSNSNRFVEAKVLLNAMMRSGCFPHSKSFKRCLAYLLEGEIAQVEKYFRKQVPNLVDYTMQIQSACKKGTLGVAKAALSKMKSIGFAPTYACYNKLVHGLSKCKDTAAESLKLFEEMLERGLVPADALPSYLLDSFCQCKQQEVIIRFCRVIIARRLTIREHSASFLLQQDDGSELKKLHFQLKESGCLVEKAPSYNTGQLEVDEEFYS